MSSVLLFFISVSFLLLTYFLMYKFNSKIVNYLSKKNISTFRLTILISIFLILIEENINTNDHGLMISIIIVIILIIQMMILLHLTKKYKPKSIKNPLMIYVIFGTLWELLVGGLVNIFSYPILFAIFMVFIYVPLSYAYFAYIPLKILEYRNYK